MEQAEYTPTILVVDDDQYFRKLVISVLQNTETFSRANYIEAENGKVAWDIAQNTRPDVVVLDLVMPEMSGQELAGRLKEKYGDIPILVLTGHDNPDIKNTMVNDVKVDSYMLKDTDQAGLVDELSRILEVAPIKFN